MKKINIIADLSCSSLDHDLSLRSNEADELEIRISGESALYIPFDYVKFFSNKQVLSAIDQPITFFQNDKPFLKVENGEMKYLSYLTLLRYFLKSVFK